MRPAGGYERFHGGQGGLLVFGTDQLLCRFHFLTVKKIVIRSVVRPVRILWNAALKKEQMNHKSGMMKLVVFIMNIINI